MLPTTFKTLDGAYLRSINRYKYLSTALTLGIFFLCMVWMFFCIGGRNTVLIVSRFSYTGSMLLGLIWSVHTYWLSRYGPVRFNRRHQVMWLLASCGLLANLLAAGLSLYVVYMHLQVPLFAIGLLGVISDIFFFVGLFFMPVSTRFHMRMGFDALITTLCVLGVSWYFVIGPIYRHYLYSIQTRSPLHLFDVIMILVYPCLDIVFVMAVATLLQRRIEPMFRASFLFLAVSFLAGIWADSIQAYLKLVGIYRIGLFFVNPFWNLTFLLIGLSGLYQYAALSLATYHKQHQQTEVVIEDQAGQASTCFDGTQNWRSIQNLLVYIPLLLLFVLTVYSVLFNNDSGVRGLVVITSIVGILVVIRYLLLTREHDGLLQEREQRRQEAERLRLITTQLTKHLEVDTLLECAATLLVTELGYDASMVVLVDSYENDLDRPVQLMVHADSVAAPAARWRLRGDNILYRIFHMEKDTEIRWAFHTVETPSEIQAWLQQQRLSHMYFLPLSYQGKKQGFIGLSNASASLTAQDLVVVRAYAEQVATALEHARLYQEVYEHETFAHAMINIATRLNAAMGEALEIGQVICEEGSNALRADYVLLYMKSDCGTVLTPRAAYVSDKSASIPLQEWAPLFLHEHEAQTIQAPGPMLLYIVQSQQLQIPIRKRHSLALSSHWYSSVSADPHYLWPLMVTADVTANDRQQRLTLHQQLAQRSVRTAILAPLQLRGQAAGLLIFARSHALNPRERTSFDMADLPAARDFVEQAGIAFTNAQLYRHLQEAHQRLKELDQLKDQFMITASHELRTPLTAIQGYVELLAEFGDALPFEQRQEFLQKARRGCDELVVLLGNVMDASRLEVEAGLKPAIVKSVNVRDVVERVLELIEPQITQEQRAVEVQIPPDLTVKADPVRLRQVMMNLSVNALKYSPPQSPLAFQAHVGEESDQYVVISIVDKGLGISPQEQGNLFQRFYRLERDVNSPVRGSGLGLYISRRLVEAMGGKIWIESAGIPGEGSIFHVHLPRAF